MERGSNGVCTAWRQGKFFRRIRHTTQLSDTASATFKARLHDLWTGHVLKYLCVHLQRNAAAGAFPKNDEGWIPYEDYVLSLPPSPDPNSQQLSAVQINIGEHVNGRLCDCF
jgi:hypothetical protein